MAILFIAFKKLIGAEYKAPIKNCQNLYSSCTLRTTQGDYSSVGRAFRLHRKRRRFESV